MKTKNLKEREKGGGGGGGREKEDIQMFYCLQLLKIFNFNNF